MPGIPEARPVEARELESLRRLQALRAAGDLAALEREMPAVAKEFGWLAHPGASAAEVLEQRLRQAEATVFEVPEPKGPVSLQGEPRRATFSDWIRQPEIRAALENERARQMDKPPAFRVRPGATLTFNGERYDVLEELGHGGFGTVFHVRDRQGKDHSVKVLHHASANVEGEPAALRVWSEKGVPTIIDGGYAVDAARHSIRYAYLHGLTVADLLGSRSLPEAVRNGLSHGYEAWFAEQEVKAPTVRNKANDIVLDFHTGRFVYIDPG